MFLGDGGQTYYRLSAVDRHVLMLNAPCVIQHIKQKELKQQLLFTINNMPIKFSDFDDGDPILMVAMNFSLKSLDCFYNHHETDPSMKDIFINPYWRSALQTLDLFLKSREQILLSELIYLTPILEKEVESLEFILEESSGDAQITSARSSALLAAKSVYKIVVSGTWPMFNPIQIEKMEDESEVREILESGWKFYALDSINDSIGSLNWTTEKARSYIRSIK